MEYRAHGGRDDDVQDIGDFIENEFLSEDETDLDLQLGSEGLKEEYTPVPGDRYEIQGRLFVVESVNAEWGEVKLRDVTFQQNAGFPIFRSEKLEFIQQYDPIREEPAEPEKEAADPVGGGGRISRRRALPA